jgi:hypothetical protein
MSVAGDPIPGTGAFLKRPRTVAAAHGVMQQEGVQVVYLAALPDGPISVLKGTASIIWEEAIHGPEDTLSSRVADRLDGGIDPIEIDGDVRAFVHSLLDRGLLEREAGDGP